MDTTLHHIPTKMLPLTGVEMQAVEAALIAAQSPEFAKLLVHRFKSAQPFVHQSEEKANV
jgi:hypothetical protein